MIALFEDEKWRKLYPLSLSHPVWELRVGIFKIFEKYEKIYEKPALFTRKYLEDVIKERYPEYRINDYNLQNVVLVNSRVIPDSEFINALKGLKEGEAFVQDGETLACRVNSVNDFFDREGVFSGCEKFKTRTIEGVKTFTYIYQLVHLNSAEIFSDAKFFDAGIRGKVHEGAHILGDVIVEEGAEVYPGVVIDGYEGPVIIDKDAVIMPNATIIGPAYIGRKSRIKVGAKIYEGTSIGPVCKIGGEVEETIIHGYSNKQHDGFLGHAYLGEWVNLGADTNNSDLKNNYSSVKIFVDGEWVNTGEMFVGLMMGDHSKSGINTMFNTGTVVGFSSNIYGGDFPPKFIPSFAWGGSGGFVTYKFEKAVETAERVMARRNIKLTEAYRKMMGKIFKFTEGERGIFESK